MNTNEIHDSAHKYADNMEFNHKHSVAPTAHSIMVMAYKNGAYDIMNDNKKRYRKALKSLEPLQKTLINEGKQNEWLKIVNCLRLCAGMEILPFFMKNTQ